MTPPSAPLTLPELLPCPLCHGPVTFCHECTEYTGDTGCHRILCPNCGEFDLSRDANPDSNEELQAVCAAAWNKRPAKACAEAARGFVLVPREADDELMEAMVAAACTKQVPARGGPVGFMQIRAAWDAAIEHCSRAPTTPEAAP